MISKYALLGILYFVQGIPYGLQSGLLPIYFRTLGLSFTKISLSKVLYVPWILKMLWALLVDQYFTKKTWLLLTMWGFVLVCLACSLMAPEADFLPVAIGLLLMNFFASIQDVAVDGVAVQLLGQDEVGYGNTIQVVAYKLGSVVAGGGLITFLHHVGWGTLFVFLAIIYTVAIGFIWNAELRQRLKPSQQGRVRYRTLNPWHILQELLQVPDTLWTAGFVLLYKLGEQGAISMFPLFLLDHNFFPLDLGFWNGIVAMTFSITGSSLGGYLMSQQRNAFSLLKALLMFRFFSLVFQTLLIVAYQDKAPGFEGAAVLSICIQHFIAGLITTMTFSMMMHCTQKAKESIQATHYSLLATLEILGKLVLSSLAGSIVDWLGFTWAFGIFLALSCTSVVYILPV
ncbi:major facilitator superfamily domain-containing protein 3 [Rhineura floridana]|uniref:major facilitator superfamily domain-containing protein 3 n=1 Tax=Rhineura floridana TaxID=261503 RepID=UPI002AC832C7|nr:major facilitator superfamily domain-containing protein 3 [Rhineura floridana]